MPSKPTTTRKPRKPLCKVCDKPAELGTICNACTEIINQHEELYAQGLRGNAAARKALKKLTKAQRQRIVPPMLSEDDIEEFINRGVITGRHQATLRTVRLSGREPVHVHTSTATTESKEDTVKTTTTPKTSTRKSRPSGTRKAPAKAVEPVVESKPKSVKPGELTAAQVAREASIDGRQFRKFLRSQSLKPTTKAQYASAVKKFKAQAK